MHLNLPVHFISAVK